MGKRSGWIGHGTSGLGREPDPASSSPSFPGRGFNVFNALREVFRAEASSGAGNGKFRRHAGSDAIRPGS